MQKVCTIDDVEQRPRRLMTCVNAIRGKSLGFYREVSNARDVVILLRLSPPLPGGLRWRLRALPSNDRSHEVLAYCAIGKE